MDSTQDAATTTMKQDTTTTTTNESTHSNATTTTTNSSAPPSDPTPRLLALRDKHASLTTTLTTLHASRAALIASTPLPSGLAMPPTWSEEEKARHALASANAAIKEHIRLLHAYNEIKDVGQGLMGLVAEGRGVRVKEVMGDFGVGERD